MSKWDGAWMGLRSPEWHRRNNTKADGRGPPPRVFCFLRQQALMEFASNDQDWCQTCENDKGNIFAWPELGHIINAKLRQMLKQTAEESIHYLKSPKIKAPSSNNSHLDLWIWVSQNLASPNPMAHFSESEAVPVAVHGCKILLQPFVLLWDHVVVVKIHQAPFKDPLDSMEGSQKLLVMVRLFTIPFILLSFLCKSCSHANLEMESLSPSHRTHPFFPFHEILSLLVGW